MVKVKAIPDDAGLLPNHIRAAMMRGSLPVDVCGRVSTASCWQVKVAGPPNKEVVL